MAEIVVQFEGTVYENGYGQIAKKVMRDKSIHAVSKAIYAYLVSYAGSKDNSFPSVQLMMDELGIKSEDTFYKYRNQLIKAGYITVHKEREEGRFDNNVYKIATVPVPAILTEGEKSPYPKKSGTVPYPKFSSTVKSSTTKLGANKNNQKQQHENPTKTVEQKSVVVGIEFSISEGLEQIGVMVSEQELQKWISKYGAIYVLEKIEVVKGMTTTAPLRTLRAAIRDNWIVNVGASTKNNSKGISERLERVVPAVQPGKYERFYRVYGQQNKAQ